jgi:hypothetical protein
MTEIQFGDVADALMKHLFPKQSTKARDVPPGRDPSWNNFRNDILTWLKEFVPETSSKERHALKTYEAAFEAIFGQCCSNPIKDAWGKSIDTTLLNEAHRLAEEALKEPRVVNGYDKSGVTSNSKDEVLATIPRTDDLMKDGNVAAVVDDMQHAWVGKKYRQAFYNDMTRLVEAAALAGGYDKINADKTIARLLERCDGLVRDKTVLVNANNTLSEEFVKRGAYFVCDKDNEARLVWPEKISTKPIYFQYINWRGEPSHRCVKPQSIRFGVSEYHQQPQWLLSGTDMGHGNVREFAMKDMHCVTGPTVFKPD